MKIERPFSDRRESTQKSESGSHATCFNHSRRCCYCCIPVSDLACPANVSPFPLLNKYSHILEYSTVFRSSKPLMCSKVLKSSLLMLLLMSFVLDFQWLIFRRIILDTATRLLCTSKTLTRSEITQPHPLFHADVVAAASNSFISDLARQTTPTCQFSMQKT